MTDTNLYGFETSNDVVADSIGLPLGIAKYMATAEDPAVKDGVTTGVVVTFECLEGANKGRSGKVWFNTLHPNPQTANIAKSSLKRLADSTGKAISPSSPIKGRVLTLDVQKQKKNDAYTEIKRFLPESYIHEEAPPF
jgi:hypothetical protein